MQDEGKERKMQWAADEESFNALCKEGGRLLGPLGPIGVIAGAQVPRLKNETKQDATLTLRLSSVSTEEKRLGM